MNIKRNIFESSARMPATYTSFAAPMTATDLNTVQLPCFPQTDANVRHAPIPRIGEQK